VLARLDDEERSWLFISYVPEIATVRNKMLYAASRSVLSKNLADQKIKDSLFATAKADLTPEAYLAHVRSSSAPKPMSDREIEEEAVKTAERNAGIGSNQSRMTSHIGSTVGCIWSHEVIDAVSSLANPSLETNNLVVITIDIPTETLVLVEHRMASLDELPAILPKNDPSYSFFAWDHTVEGAPKRDIIFVYTCPSTSPIKSRMLYSSGVTGVVFEALKQHNIVVTKRVETSDPVDLDIESIKSELEPATALSRNLIVGDEKKPFAKPRGPTRKR